jgi:hypothetical protein
MKHYFIVFFVCVPAVVFAQLGNPFMGARSAGMGHASVVVSDAWSTLHNQAALAHLENAEVSMAYENRFLMKELANQGFAAAMPLGFGVAGLHVSRFGYSKYNETKAALAYGAKLSNRLSTGVKLGYQHVQIAEGPYGNKGMFTADVGFLAKLTDDMVLGAHIFNLNYAKVAEYQNEHLPIIIRMGLGYHFSEHLLTVVEVEKDIDMPMRYKVGAEYHPHEKIYLRGGIGTHPFSNSFGFGLVLKNLKIDLAASYHSVLGYSPQASLVYVFQK